MFDAVLVHYGEISLKGKNRSQFQKKLVDNIKNVVSEDIENEFDRIIIRLEKNSDIEKMKESLQKIFGISSFSFCYVCENDINEIKKCIKKNIRLSGTVKVVSSRSDKSFKMTSLEINKNVGEVLFNEGCKISMNPENKIYIEVSHKNTYIFTEKIKGFGGLPVGTSGKVLVLFSGGIDSPVAAWMMMRRGSPVELLHFHAFSRNKDVEKTKIFELAEKIAAYHKVRLHLVPFFEFSVNALSLGSYEMVVFRKFMMNVAERLCKKNNIKAIVTGDNLSQVASQTMENISAISSSSFVVFRPLIGFNKEEIIELAKKIGTYEISIKDYKDCCSIISRHPETHATPEKVREFEEKIGMNEIVEKSLNLMETIEIM